MDFAFSIAVLILSVVVHEVSHGYAARALGDHTAEYEGRLTLNPLRHLDLFGSVLLPAMTYFLGGFIIGWAKPVPYNPYNLRPGRFSEALVAAAGPASNLAVALLASLALRLSDAPLALAAALAGIVLINITLAVFNLLPIAPLDGSKILFAFLPEGAQGVRAAMERSGLPLLIIFVFFLWQYVTPLIFLIFRAMTGLSL
jgi:Zn-dependent protease